MNFTTDEVKRLRDLTRLLGSDQEGESQAARGKIGQLLGRHGLNFNDYADWLQVGGRQAGKGGQTDLGKENLALRKRLSEMEGTAEDLRRALAVAKMQAASSKGGTGALADLRRENASLRTTVAELRSTVSAHSDEENRSRRAADEAQALLETMRRDRDHQKTISRLAFLGILAALPAGYTIAGTRFSPPPAPPAASLPTGNKPATNAPRQHSPADATPSRTGPRPVATTRPGDGGKEVSRPADAGALPAAPAWRPPPGSRQAVMMEAGMLQSSPIGRGASDEPLNRGTRVWIIGQTVISGRPWAEIRTPAGGGYVPMDRLGITE